MTFGFEKLEWFGYPKVKKLNIRLLILTKFTNVTDGHTNVQTPRYLAYQKVKDTPQKDLII